LCLNFCSTTVGEVESKGSIAEDDGAHLLKRYATSGDAGAIGSMVDEGAERIGLGCREVSSQFHAHEADPRERALTGDPGTKKRNGAVENWGSGVDRRLRISSG
jgi:hypothetical protein